MADEEAWGQLLCVTEAKAPIRLGKKTLKIGRTNDCDICFPSNKLISAKHCDISCDEDGKIWLTDTSTNGTFVNGKKVKKGEQVQISHNDQIHLVHRKNQPDDDKAYIFQDLKHLKEEDNILDSNSTQEYNVDDETETLTEEEQPLKLAKRPLVDVSDEMQPESKKLKQEDEAGRKQDDDDDDSTSNQKSKSHSHDTMGETLVCGICQDIFHDCLSLQPCMHSFCASCYSQWMDRSNDCPTCRLPVERMSRNHIVNNLVEAYLKENPGKRRPAKELAEMDAKNKITEDMVKPKQKKERRVLDEDSYDSEVDTNESEEDDDNIEFGLSFRPSSFGSLFNFTSNVLRPPTVACRWCPGVHPTTVVSTSSNKDTSAGDSSTTTASTEASSSNITSTVPHPVCPERMIHFMCLCCMKPMPKQDVLPQPHAGFTYAKSQKCGICSNFYCHLLWKCNKPGCRGCLNEFQDLDFDDNCLDVLIQNNKYESQVLKNYLNEKGLSVKDLLGKCLEKLDKKEYSTPDCVTRPELNSKYILCSRCGSKNLKDLAYQFRRDIPRDDLPAAVTSRPDCHWGRNCRTQSNPSNPNHASRYNHICEQTRFR